MACLEAVWNFQLAFYSARSTTTTIFIDNRFLYNFCFADYVPRTSAYSLHVHVLASKEHALLGG